LQAEVEGDSPRDISWIALEPIWHEDLVLVVLVRGRENISSLERLREVSEDIVDVEDGLGSIGWASDIYAANVKQLKVYDAGGRLRSNEKELCRTYKSSGPQWFHICPWVHIPWIRSGEWSSKLRCGRA
jgi:hypothetical protein